MQDLPMPAQLELMERTWVTDYNKFEDGIVVYSALIGDDLMAQVFDFKNAIGLAEVHFIYLFEFVV